jgi:hypothetical protein
MAVALWSAAGTDTTEHFRRQRRRVGGRSLPFGDDGINDRALTTHAHVRLSV